MKLKSPKKVMIKS